jgi:hypothetical protein
MPTRSKVVLLVASVCLPGALAQPPTPQAYTLTEMNATMGPSLNMKIDRDGSKVVVESSAPQSAGGKAVHTRFYYDFQNHKTYSMDLLNPSASCSGGDFTGSSDWGDPFQMVAGLMKEIGAQHPHQTGDETLNGFAAKVMEAGAEGPDKVKYWVDTKTGLMVKLQAGAQVVLEVKHLSLAKPPAAVFAIPAKCGGGPPTEAEHIAAITAGIPVNFADAMKTPPSGAGSCSVLLRVLTAGTTQPITTGFQVAIDTKVDPNQWPGYSTSETVDGHATFKGGALHEVTGQLRNGVLRIDDAPAQFHIETYFGNGGNASANIYRSCFAPQTVLLLLVKNPAKITDGVDWLWVKAGRFAVKN